MQSLVAAAGQRRAQLQPAQLPVRAEHRGRGPGQQRVVTARRENRVRRSQVRVHHAALLDIPGGAGIPGRQCLVDQLIEPGADRRESDLIQERWHQQVAVTLQGLSLLGDGQSVPAAHARDSPLPVPRAATG
jgi:hypothetical protein